MNGTKQLAHSPHGPPTFTGGANTNTNTLPSFQHLSLGSPTHADPREASEPPAPPPHHDYAYQKDMASPSSRHTYWNPQYPAATGGSSSSNAPHPPANPAHQQTQGSNPSQSLGLSSLRSIGSQQSVPAAPPPPVSPYSPHLGANEGSPSLPCPPPYIERHVFNGAQPMYGHGVPPPGGLPVAAPCLSRGHCSSSSGLPTEDRHGNRAAPPLPPPLAGPGSPLPAPPASPVQQQPQWTLPARDGGELLAE